MSLVNRKILYDKLMAEGKTKEAEQTIINHLEMKEVIKEESVPEKEVQKETKSKKGK